MTDTPTYAYLSTVDAGEQPYMAPLREAMEEATRHAAERSRPAYVIIEHHDPDGVELVPRSERAQTVAAASAVLPADPTRLIVLHDAACAAHYRAHLDESPRRCTCREVAVHITYPRPEAPPPAST